MPVVTAKRMFLFYIILVAVVALLFLLLHGSPRPGEWKNFTLLAVVGPAVLVGGLSLFAYLGKRRIEKSILSDSSKGESE